MAAVEVYQVECVCGKKFELPAGAASKPETFACAHCGRTLHVDWRPEK